MTASGSSSCRSGWGTWSGPARSGRASTATKFETRYRYANKLAEQRIKLGSDDAEAHRLLAMTLERLSLAGDATAGAQAIAEYQKALRRDPGDVTSAERLATLRKDQRKDLAGADQILDNLVRARPPPGRGPAGPRPPLPEDRPRRPGQGRRRGRLAPWTRPTRTSG